MALTVIKVPSLLNPLAGRVLLRERRPLVEIVREQARRQNVPVQVMIRASRNVPNGILRTIQKSGSDLALFGWPRPMSGDEYAFSAVVDPIIADPPCDIAVLRHRPFDTLRTLLVPVTGGPNEALAADVAWRLARSSADAAVIRLVYVPPANLTEEETEARAQQVFGVVRRQSGARYEAQIVHAVSASHGIMQAAEGCDMVIIGASSEPLLRNLLLGNVAQTVADSAVCPVLVVKRRSTFLRSVLRDTLLKPVTQSSKLPAQGPPWPIGEDNV